MAHDWFYAYTYTYMPLHSVSSCSLRGHENIQDWKMEDQISGLEKLQDRACMTSTAVPPVLSFFFLPPAI